MRNTTQLRYLVAACLLVAACGSDSPAFRNVDANGTVDTGTTDTGTADTGQADTAPVIPIDPTAADEVAFQTALDLYNALDYAGAEAAFTQFIANFPDSPRADNAAYLNARCIYESGDPAGGQRAFAQFIATHAGSVFLNEAHYFLGR